MVVDGALVCVLDLCIDELHLILILFRYLQLILPAAFKLVTIIKNIIFPFLPTMNKNKLLN